MGDLTARAGYWDRTVVSVIDEYLELTRCERRRMFSSGRVIQKGG